MKTTLHSTQILRDISINPGISQRELASKNGISLGKVNYAISALIEKGYIKIQNFHGSKNKRNYMYFLTPKGMYEKTKQASDFLKWKIVEFERIKSEIAELEADINGHQEYRSMVQQQDIQNFSTEEL
jgi:EPS-associated MarR family transcriptional regulator